MTKPVFASSVLKLVEQGRIDLDRPLPDYVAPPPSRSSRSGSGSRREWSCRIRAVFRTGEREARRGTVRCPSSSTGLAVRLFRRGDLPAAAGGREGDGGADRGARPAHALRSPRDGEHLVRLDGVSTPARERAQGGRDVSRTGPLHPRERRVLARHDGLGLRAAPRRDPRPGGFRAARALSCVRRVDARARGPRRRRGSRSSGPGGRGARGLLGARLVPEHDRGRGDRPPQRRQQHRLPFVQPVLPGTGTGIVILTNGLGGGELWTRLVSVVGDL